MDDIFANPHRQWHRSPFKAIRDKLSEVCQKFVIISWGYKFGKPGASAWNFHLELPPGTSTWNFRLESTRYPEEEEKEEEEEEEEEEEKKVIDIKRTRCSINDSFKTKQKGRYVLNNTQTTG